jgi:hypothetical protein
MIKIPVTDDQTKRLLFVLKIYIEDDKPMWTALPVPPDIFDEITNITYELELSYFNEKSKRELKCIGIGSVIHFLKNKDHLQYSFATNHLN